MSHYCFKYLQQFISGVTVMSYPPLHIQTRQHKPEELGQDRDELQFCGRSVLQSFCLFVPAFWHNLSILKYLICIEGPPSFFWALLTCQGSADSSPTQKDTLLTVTYTNKDKFRQVYCMLWMKDAPRWCAVGGKKGWGVKGWEDKGMRVEEWKL